MSVLQNLASNEKIKLLIQGMGSAGKLHTVSCRDFGTPIGAGVTPGKGGTSFEDIPIFNTVLEAIKETGVNASMILVPAKTTGQKIDYKTLSKTIPEKQPQMPLLTAAAQAIIEAIWNEMGLIVCITDGIPRQDMLWVKAYLRLVNSYLQNRKISFIGPNSPGTIFLNKRIKIGIMPDKVFIPGKIGIISRSGSLTHEIVDQLSKNKFGQSTCIGIGGDQIRGLDFVDCFKLFQQDSETEVVVLIGEIGGDVEEKAAESIKQGVITKPVVAYIAGVSAPPRTRMGHAGAIIEGSRETAREKIIILKDAGAQVARTIDEIPKLIKSIKI